MEVLPWTLFAVAIAALCAVILLHRGWSASALSLEVRDLKNALERVERAIGDNDARSFNSAEERGKALREDATLAAGQLREEVANSLKKVGDDLRENAKLMSEEQRN